MLPAWINGRYQLNSLADNQLFQSTSVAHSLSETSLGFVDVGARGGVHDLVAPIAALTAVLGFEPDKRACKELNEKATHNSPWAQTRFMPVALADHAGPAALYLCSAPTNHSLLPVNQAFAQRYRMEKFAQVGQLSLVTQTLDEVIFGPLQRESQWGEFIKLDTQGTEYEILLGATRTLKERAAALFIEVEFFQIYKKQKLFSELEIFLREFGFAFYGFHSTHERSCKLLDKKSFLGRERMLHADAVFFKDPLVDGPTSLQLDDRRIDVLFTCALILGYFDFALELARATFASGHAEGDTVLKLIRDLSFYDHADAVSAARKLAATVESAPEHANIAVGRFVDQRRAICNFEDVVANLDSSPSQ